MARADVVIACDTIYLPELHEAQGSVVKEAMRVTAGAVAAAAASECSSTSSAPLAPCAYFAQMNRNPETFAHFLSTFAAMGLAGQSLTEEAHAIPPRFAYERHCIEMHRFTLSST